MCGGGIAKFYNFKLSRLKIRLGFSIGTNIFGYGLVIPHYGTIVVGSGNCVGNYCVLHTSICITAGHKKIGNSFYCSTGAKILNDISIGDNVTVGANAVVNKSIGDNCLMVGVPASCKRNEEEPWHKGKYAERVKMCEDLKERMKL